MRLVHGGRALLNLPGHHTTAAIVAEVESTAHWPQRRAPNGDAYESHNVWPPVTCEITDCDTKVSLDFELQTANQLENSLHKIDVMVEALTAFREGLIVEHHRLHDRLPYVSDNARHGRYSVNGITSKRSNILPSEPTS